MANQMEKGQRPGFYIFQLENSLWSNTSNTQKELISSLKILLPNCHKWFHITLKSLKSKLVKKEIKINNQTEEGYTDHDDSYKKKLATYVELCDILCSGVADISFSIYIFSSPSMWYQNKSVEERSKHLIIQ